METTLVSLVVSNIYFFANKGYLWIREHLCKAKVARIVFFTKALRGVENYSRLTTKNS
ncbi:MAG: hypothetical protein UW34_C0005G0004 [Parcubacteria group bacterium GW2011_GWA2_44_15]|nr:MAG: hypothetical protein UW34_C0005G0004 [Parcubacteria group bacterium GW2011_GWA2_44_15]